MARRRSSSGRVHGPRRRGSWVSIDPIPGIRLDQSTNRAIEKGGVLPLWVPVCTIPPHSVWPVSHFGFWIIEVITPQVPPRSGIISSGPMDVPGRCPGKLKQVIMVRQRFSRYGHLENCYVCSVKAAYRAETCYVGAMVECSPPVPGSPVPLSRAPPCPPVLGSPVPPRP